MIGPCMALYSLSILGCIILYAVIPGTNAYLGTCGLGNLAEVGYADFVIIVQIINMLICLSGVYNCAMFYRGFKRASLVTLATGSKAAVALDPASEIPGAMLYTVINHLCGSAANGEEVRRQTVDMSKAPTPKPMAGAGAGGAMKKSVPSRSQPGAPPATGRPPSTDEASINVQFNQKRDTSMPRDRLSSIDLEEQQDAGVNRNARLAVSAPLACRPLDVVCEAYYRL